MAGAERSEWGGGGGRGEKGEEQGGKKGRNGKKPTADLYTWTRVPGPQLTISRETSPSTELVTCESQGS